MRHVAVRAEAGTHEVDSRRPRRRRLSEQKVWALGLDVKPSVEGDDEWTRDIVGPVVRPAPVRRYELCVLTDQHLGPRPSH